MKGNFLKILPICLFIILVGIKVDAITITTTVSEKPEATEKGSYVTLAHSTDEASSSIIITYSCDTNYLQLVGFFPTSSATCSLSTGKIMCNNVPANTVFVYPIFKVVSTFNDNKTIKSTIEGTTNTSSTTISKVDKTITVTSITLSSSSEELTVGQTYQLEATILPDNATSKTITYTSNNNEVATVNESGLITAISAGNTTITVTSGSVKTTFNVMVKDEEVSLEKINVTDKLEMRVGESQTIDISFEPENTTVDTTKLTYSSSDSKVAIVDSEGKIVAIGAGNTTITVSLEDQTSTISVTVTEEVVPEKSKNSFISYMITAVVTFFVTITIFFIKNMLKRRRELNSDNDDIRDNNGDISLSSFN